MELARLQVALRNAHLQVDRYICWLIFAGGSVAEGQHGTAKAERAVGEGESWPPFGSGPFNDLIESV